jgi:hypothetical protein
MQIIRITSHSSRVVVPILRGGKSSIMRPVLRSICVREAARLRAAGVDAAFADLLAGDLAAAINAQARPAA